MKKLKDKRLYLAGRTESDIVGKGSEDLFERMVNMLMVRNHLPWLCRFAKANWVEDSYAGIDFKFEAVREHEKGIFYFPIRIQIKSSRFSKHLFEKKWKGRPRKVWVIVINQELSLDQLRQKLDSIYLNELERMFPPRLFVHT